MIIARKREIWTHFRGASREPVNEFFVCVTRPRKPSVVNPVSADNFVKCLKYSTYRPSLVEGESEKFVKKKMGAAAAAWRKPIPKWNHCQCRRRKGEHFQIEMKIGSRVIGARNGPMLQPLCSSGTFPFKWTAHRGRLRFNCPAVAFSSGHCEKNTKMKEDSIPVSPRFSSGPEKKKKIQFTFNRIQLVETLPTANKRVTVEQSAGSGHVTAQVIF